MLKNAYHTYEIHCFISKYILYFQFDKRLQSVQSSSVSTLQEMFIFYSEIMNVLYHIRIQVTKGCLIIKALKGDVLEVALAMKTQVIFLNTVKVEMLVNGGNVVKVAVTLK